jgi:hypothetical protein
VRMRRLWPDWVFVQTALRRFLQAIVTAEHSRDSFFVPIP